MASPATTLPQLTEQEIAERRYAVDSVMGTTLAEGVSPGPEVIALFEQYVRGEIELEDIIPAIKALDE